MTELEKVPSTEAALGGVDSGWILKESGWTESHKVSLAENIIEENSGTKATFILFILTIFLFAFPSLVLVILPWLAGILVSHQIAELAVPVAKPRNPAKVLEAQVGSKLVSVTPIRDSHRPLEIRRDNRPAPEKAKSSLSRQCMKTVLLLAFTHTRHLTAENSSSIRSTSPTAFKTSLLPGIARSSQYQH